ncbi:TLD domain-containing protein [Flavobacterium ajazii]|uniref:hypothetical protein n=1 Tax=Flavobacterium ajazii TaxID=2692318 RepID=UPI0013D46B29|nr:hypothetical protein [Flavobacterium ajazii]
MDFYKFENELNEFVKVGNLEKAIEITESELKKLPTTDFHKVLNRDLLHLGKNLNDYLATFYKNSKNYFEGKSESFLSSLFQKNKATGKNLSAIYCEMNGFTINYDLWFLSGFAFSFCNDLDDIDWLADYDYSTDRIFTITGFEDLQNVYKDYMENEKWNDVNLEIACDLCAILITLRLEELFNKTYIDADNRNENWSKIPVFVTSHDMELVYKTK